jgi:hypothetical protein
VTNEPAATRQNFAVAGFIKKRESLGDEQGS